MMVTQRVFAALTRPKRILQLFVSLTMLTKAIGYRSKAAMDNLDAF